jgi:hypothetical protein
MSENNIKNMSVAQVRKSLNTLRSSWENHSPASPFCLAEKIDENITFSDFCFNFVMNHHSKRQISSKS